MSAFDVLKDAALFAQKLDNIQLYREIMSAREEAMRIQDENRQLKTRVRELEERAKVSSSVVAHHGAYWRQLEDGLLDGPFAAPLWDTDQKLVRLDCCSGSQTATVPSLTFRPTVEGGGQIIKVPVAFLEARCPPVLQEARDRGLLNPPTPPPPNPYRRGRTQGWTP